VVDVDLAEAKDARLRARLRAALAARQISQVELARAAEMEPSALSKVLAGQRRLSTTELALVAVQLAVPVGWLLGMAGFEDDAVPKVSAASGGGGTEDGFAEGDVIVAGDGDWYRRSETCAVWEGFGDTRPVLGVTIPRPWTLVRPPQSGPDGVVGGPVVLTLTTSSRDVVEALQGAVGVAVPLAQSLAQLVVAASGKSAEVPAAAGSTSSATFDIPYLCQFGGCTNAIHGDMTVGLLDGRLVCKDCWQDATGRAAG
jgi:transcriptional regulator with XRE-family HTH domain